ncbi:MAG: hypothetical protein V7K89_31585 [Nostoc sp.]|uniref:hypothetical protein n=1 Tax=Nostoc sp. TaxID=1180 RepID=UPI002FF89CC8
MYHLAVVSTLLFAAISLPLPSQSQQLTTPSVQTNQTSIGSLSSSHHGGTHREDHGEDHRETCDRHMNV